VVGQFSSSNSCSGLSVNGGAIGAYYPNIDPSGRSLGSGVGSSISLALASLGTETNSSILSLLSVNNVVGIKPTMGLTSN